MVVAAEYDSTITFEEIFDQRRKQPQRDKRKHDGGPTPVFDTIEEYIDQYLKSAGYQWKSSEFFEWKNMMDDLHTDEERNRRKDKISNRMSKGKLDRKKLVERAQGKETLHNHKSRKIYHQTCKIYQRAISMAQYDWKLSIDGIVKALRYNAANGHFIAKVNYNIN